MNHNAASACRQRYWSKNKMKYCVIRQKHFLTRKLNCLYRIVLNQQDGRYARRRCHLHSTDRAHYRLKLATRQNSSQLKLSSFRSTTTWSTCTHSRCRPWQIKGNFRRDLQDANYRCAQHVCMANPPERHGGGAARTILTNPANPNNQGN